MSQKIADCGLNFKENKRLVEGPEAVPDYVFDWSCLGIPQTHLPSVTQNRDALKPDSGIFQYYKLHLTYASFSTESVLLRKCIPIGTGVIKPLSAELHIHKTNASEPLVSNNMQVLKTDNHKK